MFQLLFLVYLLCRSRQNNVIVPHHPSVDDASFVIEAKTVRVSEIFRLFYGNFQCGDHVRSVCRDCLQVCDFTKLKFPYLIFFFYHIVYKENVSWRKLFASYTIYLGVLFTLYYYSDIKWHLSLVARTIQHVAEARMADYLLPGEFFFQYTKHTHFFHSRSAIHTVRV